MEIDSKYKYFRLHPDFERSEVGYRCSYCNETLPPENKSYTVAKEPSDRLGYICKSCHIILKIKEVIEE